MASLGWILVAIVMVAIFYGFLYCIKVVVDTIMDIISEFNIRRNKK